MPRFFCPTLLFLDLVFDLPASAVRHVQVLRLQPGDTIILFNDARFNSAQACAEYTARIDRIGRNQVQVTVVGLRSYRSEPMRDVHLAVGIPGNERMSWLVEKATELGVASIQPLVTQRTIVKLDPDRANKKISHWQSIAISACEQCGRNRLPIIHPVLFFSDWLKLPRSATQYLLSLSPESIAMRTLLSNFSDHPLVLLSGPEGGLSQEEEAAASDSGFTMVTLGPYVLRAETAPLAALSAFTLFI
jgi:16S rRNA (uracil1498-N3)-methyltransferase